MSPTTVWRDLREADGLPPFTLGDVKRMCRRLTQEQRSELRDWLDQLYAENAEGR